MKDNLISRVNTTLDSNGQRSTTKNHKTHKETGKHALFKGKKNSTESFPEKDLVTDVLPKFLNNCFKYAQRTKGRYEEGQENQCVNKMEISTDIKEKKNNNN